MPGRRQLSWASENEQESSRLEGKERASLAGRNESSRVAHQGGGHSFMHLDMHRKREKVQGS